MQRRNLVITGNVRDAGAECKKNRSELTRDLQFQSFDGQNADRISFAYRFIRVRVPQLAVDKNPLHLDSRPPEIAYREFVETETRFSMLWRSHPEDAERYLAQAQQEVDQRYRHYQQLAELTWDSDPASARADRMTMFTSATVGG